MTDHFVIERDLPEQMWTIVHKSEGDPEKLRKQLEELSREEFVLVFRGYLEAKVEMANQLTTSGRVVEVSEDTLEDIAEAIVVRGRKEYTDIYTGNRPLPPRAEWHVLSRFISVFGDLFEARFSSDIYDEVEELG